MKGELLAAHRTAPAAQPCVRRQGHDAEIAFESCRTTQRKEHIMPTNTVRFHRVLRATPEKIYRAFLNADAMAKWLPPNGFTGKVHHLDAKVGGTYKMSFTNFSTGRSHSFGGEYLELMPHERIRYTDKFDDPNLPGEMQTTITLKRVSCGTELNIVQEGLPAVIPPEACCLGWQESVILLAKTRRGRDSRLTIAARVAEPSAAADGGRDPIIVP